MVDFFNQNLSALISALLIIKLITFIVNVQKVIFQQWELESIQMVSHILYTCEFLVM